MRSIDELIVGLPEIKLEALPQCAVDVQASKHLTADSPGTDFNKRGDIIGILEAHGWKRSRTQGDKQHFTRPGKNGGISATLLGGEKFYVFTDNAAPFNQNESYSKFAVCATLEHGGDFKAAAKALASQGYGTPKVEFITQGINELPTQVGISQPAVNEVTTQVLNAPQGANAIGTHVPNAQQPTILKIKRISDYLAINTDDDPACLIGNRWLCKAGSVMFPAPSGVGKSTMLAQMAIAWGCGESFFGMAPRRPLRSLIIQAENDDGDICEQMRGVINGLKLADRIGEIDEQVIILPDCATTGENFAKFARQLALEFKPDLFWGDNLLSYIGGDVNEQKTVSRFLRNLLNPISQELGFAWIWVHHTNKPSKDPKQRNAGSATDFSYTGTGSSELTNWARAMMGLRQIDDETYEFKLGKRGKRAGLLDEKGNIVTSCMLQHAKTGLFWERAAGIEEDPELDVLKDAIGTTPYRYGDALELISKTVKCRRTKAAEYFRKLGMRKSPSTGLYTRCA